MTSALDANQANPLGVAESPNNIQKVNIVLMGQSMVNNGNKSQNMYPGDRRQLHATWHFAIVISEVLDAGDQPMGHGNKSSQGFTLIAAILILVLLSGVAVGLFYMVTNESRMGGNDLESNLAYYGAESGMEKLTADLSALYTQYQDPTNTQIQNLATLHPSSSMVGGMNYTETITYPLNPDGTPKSSVNTVSSGSNQGLYAEIIPMTLQVIAARPSGRLDQHHAPGGNCADSGLSVRRVLRI